jgi:type II secretory pathway pseudopilin PulG
MPRAKKPIAERIAALKEAEKQTQAKLAALVARQKTEERKRDTRRKIVIGGAVLAHAALNPSFADALREVLREAVTRDMDKALLADWLGAAPRRTAPSSPNESGLA